MHEKTDYSIKRELTVGQQLWLDGEIEGDIHGFFGEWVIFVPKSGIWGKFDGTDKSVYVSLMLVHPSNLSLAKERDRSV